MSFSDDSSWVKNCSDQELAAKSASGTPGCFEELIFRYNKKLFKYLQSRVYFREDIEELVQETFIKAYANIDRFDPDQKFSTWLYTIATRLMYSFHRDKKNKNRNLKLEENITILDEELYNKQDLSNLWELAKKLPPIEYQVLKLRFSEDRTLQEIASEIKKSPERVRIILQKAGINLAKEFNPKSKKERR